MVTLQPRVFGKYQLIEPIARGNVAEVFKAKSHGVEGFEKILVIKRILPEISTNSAFINAFIEEAKRAVSLSHANIVQVFDLGKVDNTYFVAMEWVAGHDLGTLLQLGKESGTPLSKELAVFIVSELAKALDYAHRRKGPNMRPLRVVHGEVSPSNVLISYEGEVKLSDFGIMNACLAANHKHIEPILERKCGYMSPEQLKGLPIDARTDIYALGVVLYEALAGRHPFEAPSLQAKLKRIQEGAYTPIAQIAHDIPEELGQIVEKAMRVAPAERYQSAAELYESLVQFLYAAGRRVGSHDLARYVAQLREAKAALEEREGEELVATLEGATEEIVSSRKRVALPSAKEIATPLPSEFREVPVLLLSAPGIAKWLLRPEIQGLLGRWGGQVIPARVPPLDPSQEVAIAFGLKETEGKEIEHAIRCAIRLLDHARKQSEFPLPSIGIDVGQLLFDPRGQLQFDAHLDALLRQVQALGKSAQKGQILVSQGVKSAAEASFVLLPVSTGLQAFVVDSELNPFDVLGKFIGRREELRRIGEVFAIANRGKLRVIHIVGEAGIGKTRLLHEIHRRLQAGQHQVGFFIATCHSFGRSIACSGLAELLRVILGVEEIDAPAIVRQKAERARALGLTPHEVDAIASLLGVAPSHQGIQGQRLLELAFIKVALRLASDRLTVFAFDNADYLDEESQVLLSALLRNEARLILVFASRENLAVPWREHPHCTIIPLRPLGEEEIARFVVSRLGAEEIPLELLREVASKSGGNPLYLESYIKALLDAQAIEIAQNRIIYRSPLATPFPRTLRGLIASHLQKLSPPERLALQITAVAGGRITEALLAKVSGNPPAVVQEATAALLKKGFLGKAGPHELAIAQEMVGEILREGIPSANRREMHAAIAQAIESLYPTFSEDLLDRLAYHHREAGNWQRAIETSIQAAERSFRERPRLALSHLAAAIQLAQSAREPNIELLLELYAKHGRIALEARFLGEGEKQLQAGIELAKAQGKKRELALLSLLRGRILVQAYKIEEGLRHVEEAELLSRQLGEQSIERDAMIAKGEAQLRVGERKKAIASLEHALHLCISIKDQEAHLRSLLSLAFAHAVGGEVEAALQRIKEAREFLSTAPNKAFESELEVNESIIHFLSEQYEKGLAAATRGLEIARESDLPYYIAVHSHNIGDAYLRLGDLKRAFASLHYSHEVARENGFEHIQYANLMAIGLIDAISLGSEDGMRQIAEAMAFADSRRAGWQAIQARFFLAFAEQKRGKKEQAKRLIQEALRLAETHGLFNYAEEARKMLIQIESNQGMRLGRLCAQP
ncbi:MAG: protein kinase [Sandaracinaceae bacterium]|nr:protein kinase [Sandaracinaceae bacterium]